MAVTYWWLSWALLVAAQSKPTLEVLVDANAQFQGEGSQVAALIAELAEGLECPVSDRVALGSACQCGGKKCEESQFCFALESEGKPTCEKTARMDPGQLELYGQTQNGPEDGKDNGKLAAREVKFHKKSAASGLRFFYSDNFRVYGGHGQYSSSRWELKIDGSSCPSGLMAMDLHVRPGENPHRVNGFGFHCKGVGKGDHRVSVHVSPTIGYEGAGRHDAYTGHKVFGGTPHTWHLEVQEIPEDYPLYHYKSGSGGDGRDSGVVNGRTLKFKKLYKDSRLRLFYSDNLRAHWPHGSGSCRWTIRVDGQKCQSGNIAGDVYVHAHDNPHRQRSFAGYCDDVPVGEHTVDVEVGKTNPGAHCDAWMGWHPHGGGNRFLLEAEEIPKVYPMVTYKMHHTAHGGDSGILGHYRVAFEKKHEETTLRLFFTENLRSYSPRHHCACVWELLVDNKHCPNAEIFGQVYVHHHHGGDTKDTNPHRVRSFAGFCDKISKGSHEAMVNLNTVGPSCDCYTGWLNYPNGNGAHGLMEVHEFYKPCPGQAKADCKGHCYWSEEAKGCRQLVPCPGHDKIAVGSTCFCGEKEGKEAKKGQFCYEDKTLADEAKPEAKSAAVGMSFAVAIFGFLATYL